MATDSDILPVDVAWRGLGHKTGSEYPDDFEDLYVATAIGHVVSTIGHIANLVDTYTVEAAPSITLPWGDTGTIVAVTDETGAAQPWERAGNQLTGDWTGQLLTILCRAVVPADVTLAARQICRQLWLADRAGGGGGGRPSGGDQVPSGFAVPKRAEVLLGPWMRPGFA